MNILVMGATGYLGNRIVDSLAGGNSIFVICRRKYETGRKNIISVSKEQYVSLFKENQIDWMINCVGVYHGESNDNMIEGNLMFPLQVINAALEHGVKNIININTALPEDLNFYSFTKRELGRFGNFYSNHYELNFYNLLVEMFYGVDEPEGRFLSSVVDRLKNNKDVELTEGKQKRDIVHVDDVCQAVLLLMGSGWKGYHDIPVGTGEGHSIREMIEYMHARLNSSSKLLFGVMPMRKNEPDSIADISLLEKLGYKAGYSWKEGLDEMLDGPNR